MSKRETWPFSLTALLSLAILMSCSNTRSLIGSDTSSQARNSISEAGVADAQVSIAPEDFIFIQASINNSEPLWFIFDSGSDGLLINSKLVKHLGLKPEGRIDVSGAGEKSVEAQLAKNVSFEFAGASLLQQTATVLALDELEEDAGREVAGIIGFPLLNRYVVEIDFDSQKVKIYDPNRFRYKGEGEIIPLLIKDNHAQMRARIALPGQDDLDARLQIDTGAASVTSMLTRPFIESHRLLRDGYKALDVHGNRGMGGEVKMLFGRAQTLKFGRFAFSSPVIGFFQDRQGFGVRSDVDGLIGGEILRRFKVIFDYPHQQLILEPNAHYAEPFEANMSGFHLRATSLNHKTLIVKDVMENSSAGDAGLHDGDEILGVDGQSAQAFTVPQLYHMFKQEGREYLLEIKRGDKAMKIKLKTRRLI